MWRQRPTGEACGPPVSFVLGALLGVWVPTCAIVAALVLNAEAKGTVEDDSPPGCQSQASQCPCVHENTVGAGKAGQEEEADAESAASNNERVNSPNPGTSRAMDVCAPDRVQWLEESILFDFGAAGIAADQEPVVRDIVRQLRCKETEINTGQIAAVVEAGTDSSGRYLYNRDLSERRADAVGNRLRREGIVTRIVGVHGELSTYPEDLRGSDESLRRARVGFCTLPTDG